MVFGDNGGEPSGDVGTEWESGCVVSRCSCSSGTVPATADAAFLVSVSDPGLLFFAPGTYTS